MRKIIAVFVLVAMMSVLFIGSTSALAAGPIELEFLFGDPNRTEIFSRIVEDFNNSQDEICNWC